jgi:hypothetical protein
MSSDRRKQRIIGGVGGLVLALAALVILWAAGVVGITVPGHERARPSGEPMEGVKLIGQDAHARLLTWRGAWYDAELRVQYGDDWFVIMKPGLGRCLLAQVMRNSGKRFTPEQLSGSFMILQSGDPWKTLDWRMYLELETSGDHHNRHGKSATTILSYSELRSAQRRFPRAVPVAGEKEIGLLGVHSFDPEKKNIAVSLFLHPIDVMAVSADECPEKE